MTDLNSGIGRMSCALTDGRDHLSQNREGRNSFVKIENKFPSDIPPNLLDFFSIFNGSAKGHARQCLD